MTECKQTLFMVRAGCNDFMIHKLVNRHTSTQLRFYHVTPIPMTVCVYVCGCWLWLTSASSACVCFFSTHIALLQSAEVAITGGFGFHCAGVKVSLSIDFSELTVVSRRRERLAVKWRHTWDAQCGQMQSLTQEVASGGSFMRTVICFRAGIKSFA